MSIISEARAFLLFYMSRLLKAINVSNIFNNLTENLFDIKHRNNTQYCGVQVQTNIIN